jgi:hypothetical protein
VNNAFIRSRRHVVAVVLTAAVAALAVPSFGDDLPLEQLNIGINRVFKVGRWTSLSIRLGSAKASHPRLEVDAPDPEGSLVTYRSEPIEPSGGGPGSLSVLFKMGRLAGLLHVRVVDGQRVLASRTLRVSADADADVPELLRQSVLLVGHVCTPDESAQPNGRRIGKKLATRGDSRAERAGTTPPARIDVVDLDGFDALPGDPVGLSSLDALLVAGRVDVDQSRSAALEQWVRAGGHLVLALGKAEPPLSKSPLASWLPVKVERNVLLGDLSSIESFCGQSARIMTGIDEPVASARLSSPGGVVLLSSLEGPLVCRAAYGLGRVTVLGVDIGALPLRRWNALGELLRRLLNVEDTDSKQSRPVAARLTQTGITELATQLDATQDEFPSVTRVTMWPIMGLLVALLIVIGPIDFLLVHKLLKRPELTWLTFPAFAVVAAGTAFVWGAWAKGDRLMLNQFDVVDVDAGSGNTRSQSWGLIYSPQNRRFDVSAETDSVDPAALWAVSSKVSPPPHAPVPLVGWHGRPEGTFGGMYRSGGAVVGRPAYEEQAGDRGLDGLPIAVWSTRAVGAEWEGRRTDLIEDRLESRGPGHLAGSLVHHFPVPIEDWVVAYGHQVFYPRADVPAEIPSGIPWSPQTARQREVEGFLTGATQQEVKQHNTNLYDTITVHEDYDSLDRDPVDVMRMLTFHTAAGGTMYTGLANGALRKLDWTPFLDLKRAVLFGRIRVPLLHWKVDGRAVDADQAVTFVRLMLPVRITSQGGEE